MALEDKSKLKVPSMEEICPYSDIDEGIDEGIDQDVGEGTYYKIIQGELLPIAIQDRGRYTHHDLVSKSEAQRRYEKNPLLEVLTAKEWYHTISY